ncbi:F-box/FBD/LRR-repeat protein At1g13570-like isoform X1 [Lycium ferocissimum]|uniref:F-box/FBD/LRR-repeat protein At1g13570-like isoform X1 n=1 Tax=Lycium ferocissimum TaxID=112874 RepID=UPI00281591A0|nr:F-box/FBD/LRR-repeat protein At1g13570-like isoform X1 [Lycium ferocissimum]XP_059290577.1 F-box/FBD/LRR-repeat protein At1g13570-like isoform X1 [Lycium ferocissimum]
MAMTDSGNILAVGGDELDRLTDLPINVIHQIQDHMSIGDAARMSVLSRTCRYIWASNPKLVFDTKFCTKRTSSNTIDMINTILLQHHGAIKIFLLDIPSIHSSQHSVVDRWMLFLSRNGLVDLVIENRNNVNAPYKLPSYVYSVALERLALLNCIFKPPCHFQGFHMLKWLDLRLVAFELDAATSSLWMPNLENLGFIFCSGLHFLNIYAPKLLVLCLYGCGADTLNRQDKAMKLTDLIISSSPNLSGLTLGRYFLKFFASGTKAESLPTRLTRLRCLFIWDYDFDSEDQLFALLSILRSSPNLKTLQFLTLLQWKEGDMEVDVNNFQGPDYGSQRLNNFQILQINKFRGSRAELLFIRFILVSAPLLRKAILLVDTSLNESQSLKISQELMRFPRASPKSEIIFEPWSIERARLSLA